MSDTTYRILMNGVTGRMGYRQHLLRSILAIRDDGGIALPDGTRLQVEPVLLGRNADKLARMADQHGIADWSTDLDTALAEDPAPIYFDAQVTTERKKAILKAAAAGKHVYTEKPIAESVEEGNELVDAAARHGIINGVVHDKLYLPGLMKLKRLVDSGFFGRILSVRGEFGYWVFEGDCLPGPAPELELPLRGRRRDGPRHVLPLELRAGEPVRLRRGGHRQGRDAHPAALGRAGRAVRRHGRRRGVRDLRAGRRDHRPGQLELGGARRAQGARRVPGRRDPRLRRRRAVQLPHPAPRVDADAGVEPRPPHRRGLPWPVAARSPTTSSSATASVRSGRSSCSTCTTDGQHPYDFAAGVRGLRLVDAGLQSSAEGRRIEMP